MTIRPIRTDKDYDFAIHLVEYLWDAPLGSREHEIFEILCELITSYERSQYLLQDLPNSVEALQFYMQQKDISLNQLDTVLEQKGLGQKLLSRQEPFTLLIVFKLFQTWDLPPQSFIKPYDLLS